MSKIWSAMLCIGIVIAVFFGNPDSVISSIMDSGKSAVENVITLIGMMCFWSGIFNIFEKTSVIKKLSKIFSKTVGFLFSKNNLSDASKEYMCMNITTNIIGVGNAATVNGIKAIKSLHEDNNKNDILATDIDNTILERAKSGEYTDAEIKNVSRSDLDKYFEIKDRKSHRYDVTFLMEYVFDEFKILIPNF